MNIFICVGNLGPMYLHPFSGSEMFPKDPVPDSDLNLTQF